VPDALPDAFELRVINGGADGDADAERTFSLDALRALPRHDVTATLQCAGNRRSEMAAVRGVRGLSWGGGAISTAVWSGALLRDVLVAQGVTPGPDARHVEFVGLDADGDGKGWGGG